MKIKGPSGKIFDVTEKSYRVVYKNAGFVPVGVAEDDQEEKGNTGGPGENGPTTGDPGENPGAGANDPSATNTDQHNDTTAQRLTAEQYAEDTKDRPAIMDALEKLGVDYDKKGRKDDLKEQLDAVLVERALMPE